MNNLLEEGIMDDLLYEVSEDSSATSNDMWKELEPYDTFSELSTFEELDLIKSGQAGRSLIKGFATKLKKAGLALTTHVGERIAERLQAIGIRLEVKEFVRAFLKARHYKQPGRKTRIAVIGGDIPVVYKLTGRAGSISGRQPLLVTVLPPISRGGSLPANTTRIAKRALNFRLDTLDDFHGVDEYDVYNESSLNFLDGSDLLNASTLPNINRKSKAYIRWLQKQLNHIESAGLNPNGIMGSSTRNAIRVFKKKYSVSYPPDDKPNASLEAFLIMFGAPPPPGTPELSRFNPSTLPKAVYAAYKKGFGAWKLVLQRALDAGITDANKLASIMFFLAHPERKGRQINLSEAKEIREWNNWRDKIKPILKARQIASKTPDLIEMLRLVPVNLEKNSAKRLRLEKLRIFLIRGLSGEQVDDRFWKFTGLDGLGRVRAYGEETCNYKGTIDTAKRCKAPGRAIESFKHYCRNARNVPNIAWCLNRVHDEILCHTNVLLGWAVHKQGLGDASPKNYPECAWLLEMKAASLRKSPESVYSCFSPLLRNAHEICS